VQVYKPNNKGRSWVQFPMVSLEVFIDIILPAALWLGSQLSLFRNENQECFLGGKGGRCLGLTTLPPLCADCLEIWEPQPPGPSETVQACNGIAVLWMPNSSQLQLGGGVSCLCYTSLMNRLHILKAVVTAVKLSVVVKRGTYHTNCHNYRITKNYLQNGPNTDKKCMKFHHCTQTFT